MKKILILTPLLMLAACTDFDSGAYAPAPIPNVYADSLFAEPRAKRDSIQKIEQQAKADSIQAAEQAKADSIRVAEQAKADSIQAAEQARADSIEANRIVTCELSLTDCKTGMRNADCLAQKGTEVPTCYANAATLPFAEDFETGWGGWLLAQEGETNLWTIGSVAGPHGGLNSAYVTNDGASWAYTISLDNKSASQSHFYRQVTFPETLAESFELSFWWKGIGETFKGSSFDYLAVSIAPLNAGIAAGDPMLDAFMKGRFLNQADWKQETISLPAKDYAGSTLFLVFTWVNDIGNNQATTESAPTPAAVDDISLVVK